MQRIQDAGAFRTERRGGLRAKFSGTSGPYDPVQPYSCQY